MIIGKRFQVILYILSTWINWMSAVIIKHWEIVTSLKLYRQSGCFWTAHRGDIFRRRLSTVTSLNFVYIRMAINKLTFSMTLSDSLKWK